MKVELLHAERDPGAGPSRELLKSVLAGLAPGTEILETSVAAEEQARELGSRSSPLIRVNGRDLEEESPRWLVEAAVLRALAPRSYLFLCVANSARSQLAEGIARSLLGSEVTLQSAGSEPTGVRPEAIEVLGEIGIESDELRSKSVTSIDPASVEVVITLCAEEVCPVFLGEALRVHWGLPDPAAVTGPERLDAFRATRDELVRRLSHLRAR